MHGLLGESGWLVNVPTTAMRSKEPEKKKFCYFSCPTLAQLPCIICLSILAVMRIRPGRSFYLIWFLKRLVSNSCSFHFPSFLYSGDPSTARCSLTMTVTPPSKLWPAGSVLICFLEPASPTGPSPFSPALVLSSLPGPWKGNLLPYEYQFGHHHFFVSLNTAIYHIPSPQASSHL